MRRRNHYIVYEVDTGDKITSDVASLSRSEANEMLRNWDIRCKRISSREVAKYTEDPDLFIREGFYS